MSNTLLSYALLILLAAIWGSSFLFIKVALGSITPLTIAAGRIALAGVILFVIMRVSGHHLPPRGRHWLFIGGAAALGNVLPFSLISFGERHVDSSLAAIMMSTIPLFTILMAHIMTDDEKLSTEKSVGVAVGFVGVVILIGPAALLDLGAQTVGQLTIACGALCYALSGIISRNLRHLPKLQSSAAIMVVAALMIVPIALIYDRPWTLSPTAIGVTSVVMLGVMATALAQVVILWILQMRGASFLSLNNYLVPLFGVFWGAVFLSEWPGTHVKFAFAIILLGVLIAQGGVTKLLHPRRKDVRKPVT
ncbi:EamA family transporter [Yoonia sp. SS1-5]|uniref:DMT family transporter n=1 Tax=Yoonia rhodophyticola TaxID=3137370 RepID=A0AAN0MJP8_9RHOB